jgi:hypothetical protein
MSVPNIRTIAPSHRENVWQERGGRHSPPRNTGGGWRKEQTRTDGDFDCPGADVLLYLPGVGLSMKVVSISL